MAEATTATGATSTYKTFLMKKAGSDWAKLVDIKDFPDLGGEPEMLETTTLSNGMQTYVAGIQSLEALTFSCNYTSSDYDTLAALNGTLDYAVWFGGTENADGTVTPTGSEGKFSFKGQLSVFVTGGGVNEVRGMTVTIAPSTVITKE
jgi:hypothetical protein